jgi:hypothetical protein
MTTTISNTLNSLTPKVVDGYSSARPSRNVVHAILGSNAPAVTLREAGLRQGSLTAVFASESLAHQLETMLADDLVLTLADTDTSGLGMTFIATDDVEVAQDSERVAWLVTFSYQEVS